MVLDAGPLLEPPVPPLVRLPVVRDAGPLLEPLAPPLVRLRAGDPAMSYKREVRIELCDFCSLKKRDF